MDAIKNLEIIPDVFDSLPEQILKAFIMKLLHLFES